MTLKPGLYHLHFVPKHIQFPFKGGRYATGENINAQIRAEALKPSASKQMISQWQVEHAKGQKPTYTISFPTIPEGSPGVSHTTSGFILPGWGIGKHDRTPEDPVLLSVNIKEWIVSPVDVANNVFKSVNDTLYLNKNENGLIFFSIAEPFHGGIIGVTSAVTEHNNRLYVQPFVTESLALNQNKITDPLPHWPCVPASD